MSQFTTVTDLPSSEASDGWRHEAELMLSWSDVKSILMALLCHRGQVIRRAVTEPNLAMG